MATKAEIIEFVSRVETESNADLTKHYGSGTYDPSIKMDISFGRKYARIISRDANGSGGSAWGFIEIATGALLKAAGWASPAKHARGNIADAAYGRNYVWTGPNYLRNY